MRDGDMNSVVENMIIYERLILASIGLVLIAVAGCSGLIQSSTRNDMPLTGTVAETTGGIPPIDVAAPERTEKATFALG